MTVLEESLAMAAGPLGGDRYITPEYLAPLPQVESPLQFSYSGNEGSFVPNKKNISSSQMFYFRICLNVCYKNVVFIQLRLGYLAVCKINCASQQFVLH